MAERKELFTVEYISDHDCGTYRIGEIDWIPNGKVERFVMRHGEYGYHQILEMCARITIEAQHGLRLSNHQTAGQSGSPQRTTK